MPIRVYIVEDHPLMREVLSDYLGVQPDLELCGMAATAAEAVEHLESAAPSLVLLDLSLPDRSGLDLLNDIRTRWRYPCIVLSGHREGSYVGRAFAAGARGYILKGRPAEIPRAIRRVMEGGIYLSESLRSVLDGLEVDTGA